MILYWSLFLCAQLLVITVVASVAIKNAWMSKIQQSNTNNVDEGWKWNAHSFFKNETPALLSKPFSGVCFSQNENLLLLHDWKMQRWGLLISIPISLTQVKSTPGGQAGTMFHCTFLFKNWYWNCAQLFPSCCIWPPATPQSACQTFHKQKNCSTLLAASQTHDKG